jgi:hypothetical protein
VARPASLPREEELEGAELPDELPEVCRVDDADEAAAPTLAQALRLEGGELAYTA